VSHRRELRWASSAIASSSFKVDAGLILVKGVGVRVGLGFQTRFRAQDTTKDMIRYATGYEPQGVI